jgi:AcrR family transcriptional regulator
MGKQRWLNREHVIAAAVALADEAGRHDGVTLTAVAASLGVRTPSLYNHVSSLADLRLGMAEVGLALLTEAIRYSIGDLAGRDALLAAALAYRRFARRHPGIYHLMLRAPAPEEERLAQLSADLLQLLRLLLASIGLRDEDALHAIRGLRAILHGFTSLETAGGYALPLDREESFRRLVTTYVDGLGERGARAK